MLPYQRPTQLKQPYKSCISPMDEQLLGEQKRLIRFLPISKLALTSALLCPKSKFNISITRFKAANRVSLKPRCTYWHSGLVPGATNSFPDCLVNLIGAWLLLSYINLPEGYCMLFLVRAFPVSQCQLSSCFIFPCGKSSNNFYFSHLCLCW